MESSWSSCYYRLIYSSLNSEVYYRAVGDHEHDGPSPKEACRAEVRTIAAHNPLQQGINKSINKYNRHLQYAPCRVTLRMSQNIDTKCRRNSGQNISIV